MSFKHEDKTTFLVTTNKEKLEAERHQKYYWLQKILCWKESLLAGECTLVGDIVLLKQSHLFAIYDSPIKRLWTKSEVKKWGAELYKSGQLNIFKIKSITDYKLNAFMYDSTGSLLRIIEEQQIERKL